MLHEKIFQKRYQSAFRLFLCASFCFALCIVPAFAEGGTNGLTNVTTGIDSLVTFFLSLIGVIGKICIGWAVFEIGTALFSHDTSQVPSAIRKVAGGAIMAFASDIVNTLTSVSNVPAA